MTQSKSSIFKLFKSLWVHLGSRRQNQFYFVVFLMVISAFADVISLGIILPFLAILISPDKIFNFTIVEKIANLFGIHSAQELVFPLTIVFICAALIAGGIRLLQLWACTKLTFATGADLSMKVYRSTLYQPYKLHISRNSSEVMSAVIEKANQVSFYVLHPVLMMISSFILLIAVAVALLAISPLVASIAIIGFSISYTLLSWASKRKLQINSILIAQEQKQVVKALQEGLGGIRDVLLDGTQQLYCDIYHKADHPLRKAYGNNVFISVFPRYAMEAIGMSLIAVFAYWLSSQVGGIGSAFPVLGALAFSAQRLLPAFQQIFSAWASIKGSQTSVIEIVQLLEQKISEDLLLPSPAPLDFQENIRFDAVRFRYSDDGPWVLNNINLTIRKGSRVGFVGSTGCGKSTLLDLLMGLLIPVEGRVLVDNEVVSGQRLRAWQRTIAHVPQNIYLADTTLAENIAFGVDKNEIDMARVKLAAGQAQIADFIESRNGGYEAFVGERGIRLSGGQRQRIGIARALYKRAKVIVFDEATSALDSSTEQSVMDAIESLSRDLTILIIAHRTTTLNRCDVIVELKNGQAVI